jgi:glycosyltransferase involved in cell wall biosynthesis
MRRMRRPVVAALIDATGGAGGAEATVASLGGVTIDEAPVQVVVVTSGPTGGGIGGRGMLGGASTVVVDAAGATHGDALSRGLAATRADRIVYLRAGVTVDQSWIDDALDALDREHGAAIVGGGPTDPVSGEPAATPAGLAFTGHPLPPTVPSDPGGPGASGSRRRPRRTMVPGDAWVARRAELDAVGSFDRRLDQPFAGIDLAWRLWLAGREVVIDASLVFVSAGDPAIESASPSGVVDRGAVERAELDALSMIYRNYDDTSLAAALPAALELSRARVAAISPTGADPDAGQRAFTDALATLEAERLERQVDRRRPDAEILGVFGPALHPDLADAAFADAHAAVLASHPATVRFGGRRRVVVATADAITAKMAGPAIRAWRLAEELALDHEVRLVSITVAELTDPRFSVEAVRHAAVDELVDWCDIFVFQGWVMAGLASFRRSDKVFVADIYDPLHLEQLEQARDDGEKVRRRAVRDATAVLNSQLLRGDYFLCASTKQRDLWLGHLASLGRVNTATYDADPGLDSLIGVVPFGISDHPPERTAAGIRGVIPGIGPDDAVILWGGGVYNWFDPLTLLRAIDRLRARRPDVRLVFLGMKHPNADIPEMRMAVEARRLSDELGLTGVHVFFNEEWVAYDHRQNFLLDADVAVTTHFHHVETDFSFRTRVLDYLWATLPTVATSGDSLADLIEHRGLGIVVPPEDVDALADALFTLLDDAVRADECRRQIRAIVPELVWAEALQPLVEFCRAPRRAPDLMEGLVGPFEGPHPTELSAAPRGWRADVALVVQYLRQGGPELLIRKIRNRATRLLGQARNR